MAGITFEGQAHYRIVVKGRLAEHTVERLGDMRIVSAEGEGREAVTVLVGPVRDQALRFRAPSSGARRVRRSLLAEHDPEVKMDKPIDATKVFAKRAEAGIVISYPQLDVPFDEAFTKAASLRQTYIEQEGKELSSFNPETARG